jgi:peroxiredoxin Q/BCP
MASGVRVGDPAPDFAILGENGQTGRLSDYHGKRAVVLFFYPKDDSPACTAEACAFRDSYEAFQDAGAEVIGVSADTDESHRKFAGRHRLPFRLISDSDGALRSSYGVPRTLGLLPGRVTYVIDAQGVVRLIFSSQLQPAKHVAEALSLLEHLPERA